MERTLRRGRARGPERRALRGLARAGQSGTSLLPAVFLDKDGTLVENVPYNVDPERIRLAPGAATALPRLQRAGYRLVVVSNQSGVARGSFREAELAAVAERLRALLADLGVALTAFLYCPHHPAGTVPGYARACACRKPAPGLLLRAAREHGLDLGRSWLVGDILDDVEAGRRAGCRTVLLANGGETEWRLTPERRPDHLARDLAEAADLILGRGGARARRPSPSPPAPPLPQLRERRPGGEGQDGRSR